MIIKVREKIKAYSKIRIAVNSDASFWSVPWMQKGLILSQVVSYEDIMMSEIPYNAKAKTYVRNGRITLPRSNSANLNALWNSLNDKRYDYADVDEYVWNEEEIKHATSDVYSTLLNEKNMPKCVWSRRIWTVQNTEKLNFFMWKVCYNALNTKRKLAYRGMNVDKQCILCMAGEEDVQHLYFSCPLSSYVWKRTKQRGGYAAPLPCSDEEWHSIYKATRWKMSKTFELLIMLKAVLYEVWMERNCRIFNRQRRSNVQVFQAASRRIGQEISMSSYGFDILIKNKWK